MKIEIENRPLKFSFAAVELQGRPWPTGSPEVAIKSSSSNVSQLSGPRVRRWTCVGKVLRGDVVRILHDATKDDVEYVFGKTVERFEQDDERF